MVPCEWLCQKLISDSEIVAHTDQDENRAAQVQTHLSSIESMVVSAEVLKLHAAGHAPMFAEPVVRIRADIPAPKHVEGVSTAGGIDGAVSENGHGLLPRFIRIEQPDSKAA